jgi:RNA polymerase sigma-70 factor (ECF subfamily)
MSAALAFALFASDPGPNTGSATRSPAECARDAEWVRAIRLGEIAAFEGLFRAYFEPLLRYAVSYTHDTDAAHELVADFFARLWEQHATWDPVHGAAPYLYGAVRNRALNHQRGDRRRAAVLHRAALEPEVPGLSVPDEPEIHELHDARAESIITRVRAAVEQLPPSRREAMILRWDHQMTPEQIAEVMGLSRTAVYHLLERSLRTLREIFAGDIR